MSDLNIILICVFGFTSTILLVVLLKRISPKSQEAAEKILRDELRAGREEAGKASRELREEISRAVKTTHSTISDTLAAMGTVQKTQLESVTKQLKELTDTQVAALDKIRTSMDTRVKELQEGNEKKLEEMRKTVDEKLQSTLEKRLGESFKIVGDRLEAVQRGLGEMQNLAAGVGDLKKVLTNVKTRGTWGEVQLGAILEQILSPDQYAKNVQPKADSREIVEFAVRLPGPDDDPNTCVWLPIDAKTPQEDYLRLQEASEAGDADAVQRAATALARAIKLSAQDIHDKYIDPPATTDFGIMFLATEGMYAEVLRQPGLMQDLQQNFRVMVAGPTTLAALLNSLRMGFRTLAIEKQASEVWKVLAAVKTEFGKFGNVLDKVKKQLDTASKTIDATGARTRAMQRKLTSVEQLPGPEASELLELPAGVEEFEVEDEEGDVSQDEVGSL